MNTLDITFELSPWEAFLQTKQAGDTVTAGQLLTLLEGEEEQALEEALEDLDTACIDLSVEDLPRTAGTGEAALRLKRELDLVGKGLKPELLEQGDPLRLYLEELSRIPAQGDEQILSVEASRGREDAMVQLTNLGLSRVVELAGEYAGYGVLLLDLIQEGSLGLWQAVHSFHGGDYAAHRDRWIRRYLAKAVTIQARSSGVGQKMRTAMEDYRAVDERLLGELGRNATLEEIALELHMSVDEADSVRKMMEDARNLARNKKIPASEEENAIPEEEDQAVENTALFQMRQRISDLLSGLSQRDSRLLTLRFGLEGGLPKSPEEVGAELGMTPEEVVAAEAAALSKLRQG